MFSCLCFIQIQFRVSRKSTKTKEKSIKNKYGLIDSYFLYIDELNYMILWSLVSLEEIFFSFFDLAWSPDFSSLDFGDFSSSGFFAFLFDFFVDLSSGSFISLRDDLCFPQSMFRFILAQILHIVIDKTETGGFVSSELSGEAIEHNIPFITFELISNLFFKDGLRRHTLISMDDIDDHLFSIQ